ICQSVARGLGFTDMVRSGDFQARTALLALDLGEPARISEALSITAAHVAGHASGEKGRERANAMLELASRLAEELGDPKLVGTSTLVRGALEFNLGHWLGAVDFCDRANAMFREQCTGVWWHQYMAASISLWGLLNTGRLLELFQRIALWSAEATARGI